MSGPGVVCIKRKRSEPAPERLIVEPTSKRNKNHIQYILRKNDEPSRSGELSNQQNEYQSQSTTDPAALGHTPSTTLHSHSSGNGIIKMTTNQERRTFHLRRPDVSDSSLRKRKYQDHRIATFVERQAKRPTPAFAAAFASTEFNPGSDGTAAAKPEPFKRPGTRATVPDDAAPQRSPVTPNGDLAAVAESLHRFAIEEAAREENERGKPKLTSLPKLSGLRSRERHRQRTSMAGARGVDRDGDAEMEEDTEYVYDTYVLAPNAGAGAAQIEAHGVGGSVGYLIITAEDQAVWETYMEDEPSDKDWDSEEDDENAEDWYGADYPDEELASDDEFDQNVYGYRANGGSDDEEWTANAQSWSDDEYERQMQPWRTKTAQQFRKYLERGGDTAEENE